jgi:hypothetical protein
MEVPHVTQRNLGSVPENSDGIYLLELDLKAGLQDSTPERVLDSIRMRMTRVSFA